MGATAQQATNNSRLTGERKMRELAVGGLSAVNTIMGIIGALESVPAVSAGGASVATRWSVFMLPVATFLIGTSIRQSHDEEQERKRLARLIILSAGFQDAVEKHGKKFPKSKILDPSTATGIKISSDKKYTNVANQFAILHRKWWRDLDEHIEKWAMVDYYKVGDKQTWEEFVTEEFNEISKEYANLLVMTEYVR